MARRRTKTVLSDDKKFSRMENWARQQGFPADTAKRLTEKYGMYAYDLMLKALMSPASMNLPGCKFSKQTIHYLLGEDRKGNPLKGADNKSLTENTVSTAKIASLVGKDITTVESDINEFCAAHDIPTELPAPAPEVVAQYHKAQTRVEERVNTAASLDAPFQTTFLETTTGEAEWIEQELARMKGGKDGELSFETLHNNGLTDEDMQNALTEENVKDVHAGPTSQKLARHAPRIDRNLNSTGRCLAAVQYNTCRSDTTNICYANVAPPRLPGNRGNAAANCQIAWENSGKFTVFKFKNDHTNTCLYDPPPCAGAIVNYEQGCRQTKDGHVAISDGKGTYYCDFAQDAEKFAQGYRNNACTQPYGDFYISFTNDCTVSDELARKMLHERYIREHPNAMEKTITRLPYEPARIPVTQEQSDSVSNTNLHILNFMNDNKSR